MAVRMRPDLEHDHWNIRGCEPFKGMRIIMVKKLITVELASDEQTGNMLVQVASQYSAIYLEAEKAVCECQEHHGNDDSLSDRR